MSNILVLIACGGEYEDAWEQNIAASFDREKLEQKQAEHLAEIKDKNIKAEKFSNWLRLYTDQNPKNYTFVARKKYPNFNGIKKTDYTDDMRAAIDIITRFNKEADKENAKNYKIYTDKLMIAREQFLKENDIDDYSLYAREEPKYSIEELEVL